MTGISIPSRWITTVFLWYGFFGAPWMACFDAVCGPKKIWHQCDYSYSLGQSKPGCINSLMNPCPGGGIGRRAGFRCQWPQGRGSSSLLLGTISLLNMCVNEARIVNRIRTDRGTLNYLHDYSGVVGGFLRVLVFRDGWKKFCNKYSYNFTGWYFHTTVLIHKKPHERSCASLRCFFL